MAQVVQRFIRSYKSIATYAVILLVCMIAFVFGLIPVFRQTFSLYSDVQQLSDNVSKLREKVRMIQSLDEETIRTQLIALLAAVPQEKAIPALYTTIDAVSAQTGVTVTDMTFTAGGPLATEAAKRQSIEEKKLGVSLMPFSLSVEGELEKIHAFLEASVKIRRLYRIRQIVINIPEAGIPQARMDVDGFFTPFPPAIADVTQSLEPMTAKDDEIILKVSSFQLASTSQADSIPLGALPQKEDPFAP